MSNEEHKGDVLGVPGTFSRSYQHDNGTWAVRRWISPWRAAERYGRGAIIQTTIRFDDSCGNGHDSFAITADIRTKGVPGDRGWLAGGCCHEEIAKAFPELAGLIKWRGCSTDGPIHYIANTVFLAGDKDHRGLRKGETKLLINGRTKLPMWEMVIRDQNGGIVSGSGLARLIDSETKPVGALTADYEPVLIEGEGKGRQLGAARRTAVWPEATDEELCGDNLPALLAARLPDLMGRFRAETEAAGFEWID